MNLQYRVIENKNAQTSEMILKFMISKKATKIEKIFTVDLTPT